MVKNISLCAAFLTAIMCGTQQLSADEIYATYETINDTGGIAWFNATTLHLDGNIATSVVPTDVTYGNGFLYDLEGDQVIERDPLTGAANGNTTTAGAGTSFTGLSFGLFPSADELLIAQHSSVGQAILGYSVAPGGAFSQINDLPGLYTYVGDDGVHNLAATQGSTLYVGEPSPLSSIDVSSVLGNLGHVAVNGGESYVAYGGVGELGPGIAFFDGTSFSFQGIQTASEPGGVAYGDGNLYYDVNGTISQTNLTSTVTISNTEPIFLGALVYVATPEPSGAVLLGIGAAALAAVARRRMR
jgi:hypothetical protein